jgi:hypothetical protein
MQVWSTLKDYRTCLNSLFSVRHQAAGVEVDRQQYVWLSRIRIFQVLRKAVGRPHNIQRTIDSNTYKRIGRKLESSGNVGSILRFFEFKLIYEGGLWRH